MSLGVTLGTQTSRKQAGPSMEFDPPVCSRSQLPSARGGWTRSVASFLQKVGELAMREGAGIVGPRPTTASGQQPAQLQLMQRPCCPGSLMRGRSAEGSVGSQRPPVSVTRQLAVGHQGCLWLWGLLVPS